MKSTALSLCLFPLALAAQITDPIPGHPADIPRPGPGVAVEEVAEFPLTEAFEPRRLNYFEEAPDGSGRFFLNDQQGTLWVVIDGEPQAYLEYQEHVDTYYNDTESGQQGFTYFTFDPEFARNGIFYTVSSEEKNRTPDFPSKRPIINNEGEEVDSSHHDVLRRWQAKDPAANTFDGVQEEFMRIDQPFRDHNTGQLGFNPLAEPGDDDYGMLYIAGTDGGSDGFPVSDTDPLDNGQDLMTPLGALLRIDPFGDNSDNGQYGVPSDNPFTLRLDALDEIYAYGFRNPHRFSWDTAGRQRMFMVDIGQWYIEELNIIEEGENYGWGNREGTWVADENNEFILYPLPDNDPLNGYTYPVAMYAHPSDNPDQPWTGPGAIAGGYVYRGTSMPQLVGKYIFGDFSSIGKWFYVEEHLLEQGSQTAVKELTLYRANRPTDFLGVVGAGRSDVRFGTDREGELYATSKQNGTLYRLTEMPNAPTYSIEPTEASFSSSGGSAQVTITADGDNPDWGLSNPLPDWITLDSPPHGTDDGTLSYAVVPNTTNRRRSHDLIVAGEVHEIIQEAADTAGLSVFPPSFKPDAEGGTVSVSLDGDELAAIEIDVDWIVIEPDSMTDAAVELRVLPNFHGARETNVYLNGVPFPIEQDPYADSMLVALSDAVRQSQGYRSSWFGRYNGSRLSYPWIKHEVHGWIHLEGSFPRDDFWVHEESLGYWYTSQAISPYFFLFDPIAETGEWYYLDEDSVEERRAWSYAAEEWISL